MGPYLKDDEWLYQESGVRITTTLHTPLESYLVCTLTTRLSTSIILRFVSSFVVGAGIEPARTQCPLDFLTTIVFTTNQIVVCGLDYPLTISV